MVTTMDRMENRNSDAYWKAILAGRRVVTENEAESWYELDHSDRNAMWDVEFSVCFRDPQAKRCGEA